MPVPGICIWVICLGMFSVLLKREGDKCLIRELTVFKKIKFSLNSFIKKRE